MTQTTIASCRSCGEEELINEEAKEAAAFLQTDIPVIRPGQVLLESLCSGADILLHAVTSGLPYTFESGITMALPIISRHFICSGKVLVTSRRGFNIG